jgi:hypothetical protein
VDALIAILCGSVRAMISMHFSESQHTQTVQL